jgi:hypothetical protein
MLCSMGASTTARLLLAAGERAFYRIRIILTCHSTITRGLAW